MKCIKLILAQPSNGNNNGKPVNPVSQCIDGYQYFSIPNSCYKYVDTSLSFKDAEKYCKNQSGQLVSIHSLEEDEIVTTMYYQHNTAWGVMWIGLNDFTGDEEWAL
uniref:C-type lectin domain-containing protein n=1 Tax=Acrobeloides nanus TaxID=290746 RepID=A0A914DRA6_9BILA